VHAILGLMATLRYLWAKSKSIQKNK